MLIRLSQSMALEIRHLRKRGEIYQFYLRVPVDLVPRYGQEFIRQSLRTSDERIAVRKATELTKRYRREFEILRGNPQVAPQGIGWSAKEIAQAIDDDSTGMLEESLLESKRRAYAEQSDDPEYTYAHADISEYLSPVEARAVRILHEGLDTIRLSDAIGLYWKHHKRTGDSTYMTAVERDWNRLIAFAGDIAVESLSRPMARQFVDHLLSEGLKTTSVRRKLNYINAILNTAIREGELKKQNPFANLKIQGEGSDAKPASVPEASDLKHLASTLREKSTATALIALIMVETGPRIAEISGLKVTDVFLDAPVPHIRITPNEWRGVKTISSVRECPLVGISLEAMKNALKLPRQNDALFPNYARENGGTTASAAVNKILKPWGITSKSFRHALKDRLREVGCPKDIRDAIQGHENGEIAETYGKGHTLNTMRSWLDKAKLDV